MSEKSNVPLVSIGIIAYNQELFIAEAIQSALDQNYAAIEVVVGDDGSTDRTPQIIRDFAKKYPSKVIPIIGENLGITKNSNRVLFACSGKYICIMGGDDVLLPEKIKQQVDWLEGDQNRVFCGHACDVFYEDKNTQSHIHFPKFLSEIGAGKIIEWGSPYLALSVLFRKNAIPDYGFDERLPIVSDYKLWIDLAGKDGSWGAIDGVHARYRRHAGGVTHYTKQKSIYGDIQSTLSIVQREHGYVAECLRARTNLILYPGIVWAVKHRRPLDLCVYLVEAGIRNPVHLIQYFSKLIRVRFEGRHNRSDK